MKTKNQKSILERYKQIKDQENIFHRMYLHLISNPIRISVFVFFLSSIIVISITIYFDLYSYRFRENVLVEAHGTLFDILILGVFVLWLQRKGSSKLEKTRYIDEIDDFRNFVSEEAARKIKGNIKRLLKKGENQIDLSNCYLMGMDLRYSDLHDSYMWGANFEESDFRDSNLHNTNLEDTNFHEADLQRCDMRDVFAWKAKFKSADLRYTDLENANLRETNCSSADFDNANLKNSNLWRAKLIETNFWKANLSKSDLTEANLEDTHFRDTDLREVKGLTLKEISKVKTLFNAKLDKDIEEKVKKHFPELLEEPKIDEDW